MNLNFRRAVFVLIVILILAGTHLFFYTQNVGLKYQITDLKVKLSELKSQNREWGGQVAKEENLAYVEKMAKEKLEMIYPEKITYILASKEASPGTN